MQTCVPLGPWCRNVEEGDDVRAAGVCAGEGVGGVMEEEGGKDGVEELDLVECCFGVAQGGLDDFEHDVAVHPSIGMYRE
jgi:hypothetical protein